jgi:hypothetical protein
MQRSLLAPVHPQTTRERLAHSTIRRRLSWIAVTHTVRGGCRNEDRPVVRPAITSLVADHGVRQQLRKSAVARNGDDRKSS